MNQSHTSRAFSLVELVVVLAVLAAVVGVGLVLVGNYRRPVTEMKLEQDVATLNSAVRAYLASGGSLESVPDLEAVLAKLKTTAADAQREEIAGLKGSFLDRRVKAVLQTSEEAATSQPRITWVAATKRFAITTGGAVGAKQLVLDEAITGAAAQETRDVKLKLATENNWVWDYEDRTVPGRASYSEVPLASVSPTSPTATSGASSGPLQAPQYSLPGGTYALADYDLSLSLTDPNPASISQLMFSTDAGATWQLVSSGALPVAPNTTVSSYAMSIDPDRWADSPVVTEIYEVTPVQLELEFTVPQLTVNYGEAGGAMIAGSSGAGPVPQAPGWVDLANALDIPNHYQNNSVFTMHWSYDGSDPVTSGNRETAPAFSNGFPGQAIDYSLIQWGNNTVLPIQVVAESLNPALVTTSTVATRVLTVDPIALRAPVITITGPDVTIEPVTDYGDTPVDARIYYTTDGSDPGDLNGTLTSGTLYTGPFPTATVTGGNPVKARVYAPDSFEPWFVVSDVTEETPPAGAILFSMLVATSAP